MLSSLFPHRKFIRLDGGMGSMLGSILSATVLTILPEATRSFESYRMVVYSLVLVLMMIFRPGGLLGSYDFSLSRIVEKAMNGELFRKHTKKEAADQERVQDQTAQCALRRFSDRPRQGQKAHSGRA